jgi:non-reducing end alpha-L-arabinofuranosidase
MAERPFQAVVSLVAAMSVGVVAASCGSFSSGTSGAGGSAGTGSAGSGGAGTAGNAGAAGTGVSGTYGSTGTTGAAGAGTTPCDVLNGAGNPCVAAHSTARVVYPGYTGPLYQVCKGSFVAGPSSCTSGMTMDIGSVTGGYADSTAQDTFCTGGSCTISIIYDQSPMRNDLKPAPAGGQKLTPDNPVSATALTTTLNGHKVYGVYIKPGMGYRAGCAGCGVVTANGTATGDDPETIYMVTTPVGLINGCCFDYGNAETDSHDDGNGTMEAVYFGGGVIWGTGSPGGHTNGPWVMADLENGIYAGWENNQDQNISTNTPLKFNYVTGVVVGDTADKNGGTGRFAVYGGDATTGSLMTLYDGIRPAKTGYVPMHKQGSIIFGTGGDNSSSGAGQWFEGCMASGAATAATVNGIQSTIIAAGYGQ